MRTKDETVKEHEAFSGTHPVRESLRVEFADWKIKSPKDAPQFKLDLEIASRRMIDMAKKAIREDKAGETEDFPV